MKDKIYIDFEMNKQCNRLGEIIAIGAVKVRNNEIIDTFHSLAALQRSDEIHVDITLLTGITNFDIVKAPTFSEA